MIRIFLLPLAAYVALPGLLGTVVVAAKASRSARERASRLRRERIRALLEAGRPDAALRLVGHRSRRARDDLAAVFVAAASFSAPYRRAVAAAVAETPLRSGIARDLRARDPVRRAKATLAAARLELPEAAAAGALLLVDPDPDVRSSALRALGLVRRPEAAWLLLRALAADAVPPERAVERLATPWAVEPLRDAFERVEFVDVRRWLVGALALARARDAEPLALRLLRGQDPEDRVHACRALAATGSAAAVGPLLAALGDVEWTVRAQSARALGEIRDPRAVAALTRALADNSWWVRSNAAQALRKLGVAGFVALRSALNARDRYARERAAEALALESLAVDRAEVAATG